MEQGFCTESEVLDILEQIVIDTGDNSPYVMVFKREQNSRSFMRHTEFVVRTKINNEPLVNAINKWSAENDQQFVFKQSEVNLQNASLESDYLIVTAYIAPNLTI